MRVAITGATGFVGGHLARRLVELSREVVITARDVNRHDPWIFNTSVVR